VGNRNTFATDNVTKTIGYYAVVNKAKAKGVVNKINDIVATCNGMKYPAKAYISAETFSGIFMFFKSLLLSKHKIIFIRYTTVLAPLVFFICLLLRLKGKKIIIDVPTPRRVALQEVLGANKSLLYKVVNFFVLIISSSWVFMPANLVIQYADESCWFSFGLNSKTLKMGNGIVIRPEAPLQNAAWPNNELVLIGAAQLAYWHGFDRVLRAMHELKNEEIGYQIRFIIAGDGGELQSLKELVTQLNLQDSVEFRGVLTGAELDNAFAEAHVGIASLGLYRKNLTEASDLKTREYLSRGFMVIAAGNDIDFPEENAFRIQVTNDNSIEDLKQVLRSFSARSLPDPNLAKIYAKENLSFEGKLQKVFSEINCYNLK
jgi:glycosyltransferase involved in cell wall biosynthesis